MLTRKLEMLTKPSKIAFRKVNKPRNGSSASEFKNSQLSESRLQLQPLSEIVAPRTQSLSILRNKNTEKHEKIRSVLDTPRLNQAEQSCLCGACNCGRHLCKFEVVKADLTNNRRTSYRR